MFGRSGQMFPRQRTFHDAIYEEEYGSDNEDECCRCRGLSAILCWFLSVIILVGLAATVVLTVFFILRSRTLMVKPDVDVDVELYGKDSNLYEGKGGGGSASSKELLGSNEVTTASTKRKKSNTKGSGRGPPDATKNDVDADVSEDQNAINDGSEQEDHDHDIAEDASVNHARNHHPNHQQHNRNRLQPYSPVKSTTTSSTTTTTTTEAPKTAEQSDEENNQNESSSEEETDAEQSNGEGSSLFNLFSGPRNPSYSTPSQNEDEEEEDEEDTDDDDANNEEDDGKQHNKSGITSSEYSKPTRYPDGAPVQQVLFTESPKVTVTTSSPYGSRRNLQTTRMSTGRTSFTSTTTTVMPPSEESEEEEEKNENGDDNEPENEEEGKDDAEKSSEEKQEAPPVIRGSFQPTTTSVYDDTSSGKDNASGSSSNESGESQLKQMLLDSIPPHGAHKDDEEEPTAAKENEEEESGDDEEMGGMSSSSEFNLGQKIRTTTKTPETSSTTTLKPVKTTKSTKQRGSGDTISRLISRNFTRKTSSTTTETAGSEEIETQTERPSTATTIGPAGHKYDFTMTPNQRTKVKGKSAESTEQEVTVTSSTPKPTSKYTLKQRFRSTTVKPSLITPEPPSTAAPRTRGTTPPATSTEYGIKLGGSKRGSIESPIDIVPSPDLSPKGQLKQQIQRLKEQQQKKHKEQQSPQPNSFEGVDLNSASSEDQSKTSSEQQFLDVLVGADDKTSLVTKKTEDGIVTSAILPPWYDSNGANNSISDVLATNGTTLSNTVAKVPTDAEEEGVLASAETSFGERTSLVKKISSEEKSTQASSKETQGEGPSEFERLVNMFSNQEQSSEDLPAPPPTNRFGNKRQKPIVLKKPGGSINYIPQVPGRAGYFPASSSTEAKSSENKSSGPSPSPASPEVEATTNLERPPGDVGRTGVLPTAADVEAALANSGYYPENDGDPNNAVEHQAVESERLPSEEMMDSPEDEQGNPSHVIDVNIAEAGDSPAEIVIEQDSSAPAEDEEEEDFLEDEDYGGYGENPPALAMSGSTPNQNVVAAPEDYVLRGSGIRRPVSSEETSDLEPSASVPVENNVTTVTTTTGSPQILSTPVPVAAIRRPAYTREEIAKSSVKPSPGPFSENNLNDEQQQDHREVPQSMGSVEEEFEEEYDDDDNYDGGSVEQQMGGTSLEQWSSEKTGQRWSAPDKIMNTVEGPATALLQRPRPTLSEELTEPDLMTESAESIAHPTVEQSPINVLENQEDQVDNSTGAAFKPPALVSFHENKLSFAPPTPPLDGEYHSKDGWRPVLTGGSANGGSQELQVSEQTGSFEPEEEHSEQVEQQQQVYQEPPVPHQQQVAPSLPVQVQPPPPQQWAQEQPSLPQTIHPPPVQQPVKHNSIIPPPVSAMVKFPDSEEDHEDRRHHGRHRPRPGQGGQFDRAKYMTRPVPPPIVMRRRPPSGGPPYPPPPGHNKRQGPPHLPPNQRPPPPQMMQGAASQHNPQYAEKPPPPQGRPPHPPINRNFHMRHNPMRRFNYGGGGGPPLAQPRSGGNIKWPTDDGDVSRENSDNSQQQHVEGIQSEVSIGTNRRRRRRRAPVLAA